ncbi:hypothetical protein CYMTET_12418 [Cymbomonas tetramitiformis]|uniref:Uncharacterized protein n=1 Tax=Cymbomonas tetramitiformis TaxID=36881 RepID=A0AAE0GKC6_9CHLO|nr:hypothetical protein CYMTET_12418 [Cymbomonas tetramitiformis]
MALGAYDMGEPKYTSAGIYRSVMLMSLCFSLNHGCVTSVIGLASIELGDQLGGDSLGLLYVMYTCIALVGATGIVEVLGQKWALVAGTSAYCVYVATFVFALAWQEAKWPICMSGSFLGGCAAGWLWTAQGGYFNAAVELYAKACLDENSNGQALLGSEEEELAAEKKKASSTLAGLFSTCYLSSELGLKVMTFFLLNKGLVSWGKIFCYIVLTIIAVVSAFLMTLITDLEDHNADQSRESIRKRAAEKTLAAINLCRDDPKMLLMYPTQMTFGFCSSFLNFYVSKNIVKEYIGKSAVPLLGGLISLIAASFSIPTGWISNRVGKPPVMIAGIFCFLVVMLIFTLLPDHIVGTYGCIIPAYVLYGLGRCMFEGQNKAILADFFPSAGAAWGANVIVSSGGSAAIGFFLFPHISNKITMGSICIVTSGIALCAFLIAAKIYRSQQAATKIDIY